MAIVSISHAAKLVRKGRQTLYNHNDKGKLSFTKTEDGKPGIDTAELQRVYGKLYMPADKVETVIQDSSENSDSVRQAGMERADSQDSVHSGMSNPVSGTQDQLSKPVSMDNDTASTLSWFMEQVDELKEELADTEAQLADRDKSLSELRQAMSALPSPESVKQRLEEQAERLEKQHNIELAEQKTREKQQAAQWEIDLAERMKEIQAARTEAQQLRDREQRQAHELKLERERLAALEARGFIDRLLNRKPKTTAG